MYDKGGVFWHGFHSKIGEIGLKIGEEAQEGLGCAAVISYKSPGNAVAVEWSASGEKPEAKPAADSLSEGWARPGCPFNAQGIE